MFLLITLSILVLIRLGTFDHVLIADKYSISIIIFSLSLKKNTFYYIYMFYHVPAFLKFASPWPLYHTIHINLTILIHAEQDCTIDHSWIRCRRSPNPNNISTCYEIWQSNTTTSCVWKFDVTSFYVRLICWYGGGGMKNKSKKIPKISKLLPI